MGIVSFSDTIARSPLLAVLLAPLQTLAALFVPVSSVSRTGSGAPASKPTCRAMAAPAKAMVEPARHAMLNRPHPRPTMVKSAHFGHLSRPQVTRLKVLREFDPGIGRAYAGRMIISGRMADVCAELDRMERRESSSCHH